MAEIKNLIQQLKMDSWRKSVGFSPEIDVYNQKLIDPRIDDRERIRLVRDWLAKHQPCVFGRLAAGVPDLISFCVLGDYELQSTDSVIRAKIQAERTRWRQLASSGEKSAFVIVALCEQLMNSAPDATLAAISLRLLELYLLDGEQALVDRVYQDRVFLYDSPPTGYGRWFGVGSNFFGAQGDKRWWHDHRFPGGIAFSMNSPGHMAHAGAQRITMLQSLSDAVNEQTGRPLFADRGEELKAQLEELKRNNVYSLEQVLKFAMLTIRQASSQADDSKGPTWDKATMLLRRDSHAKCPFATINEDEKLAGFDSDHYLGWYHTDYTVPSEYFREGDGKRPQDLIPFALDFTYIHDPTQQAYKEMSGGEAAIDPFRLSG